MPAITTKRYYRSEIRQHRDRLYVFGDNLQRRGFGGQAKEARGEPNAVGIPTKASPHEYLRDEDFERWIGVAIHDLMRIHNANMEGLTVVWPEDGIGTGLARLRTMAPRIWNELQAQVRLLGGPAGEEVG